MTCLIVAAGTTAWAQQRGARNDGGKGSAEIEAGYRATSITFTDSASPKINAETAQVSSRYTVPSGISLSGSAGWRLWRRFGLGVGVSRYSEAVDGDVSGSIPHPFVFGQLRQVSGAASGVRRDELAVTVQLRGEVPVSNRLSVSVYAGPAWVSVRQQMVTAIDYTESYPYDTATFRSAALTSAKKTQLAPAAGVGLSYFFSRQVGLGVSARFIGGKVEWPGLAGATTKSKIGGAEIGGGLRLRF